MTPYLLWHRYIWRVRYCTYSGTGSISYCYNKKTNELNRVGGWGYVLGDEGSGYDIGRQALVAIMKSYDGRGKSTQLTEALKNI